MVVRASFVEYGFHGAKLSLGRSGWGASAQTFTLLSPKRVAHERMMEARGRSELTLADKGLGRHRSWSAWYTGGSLCTSYVLLFEVLIRKQNDISAVR